MPRPLLTRLRLCPFWAGLGTQLRYLVLPPAGSPHPHLSLHPREGRWPVPPPGIGLPALPFRPCSGSYPLMLPGLPLPLPTCPRPRPLNHATSTCSSPSPRLPSKLGSSRALAHPSSLPSPPTYSTVYCQHSSPEPGSGRSWLSGQLQCQAAGIRVTVPLRCP